MSASSVSTESHVYTLVTRRIGIVQGQLKHVNTRSAAVAKNAANRTTAYDVRYSGRTEPPKTPRLEWLWSRDLWPFHDAEISAVQFICCVLLLHGRPTSYSYCAKRQ